MPYDRMKNTILFKYHKNIDYWYRLLGEMFEGTEGFKKPYKMKCTLDGKAHFVSWNNYEWDID